MAFKIHRHKYKINSSETLFVKDLHNFCRIKGSPPPIIFERLKLPQQIIYLRKENLSESPNHLKYWGNILILQFYKQFSRSTQNLGQFWKFKKIQTLRTQTYHI